MPECQSLYKWESSSTRALSWSSCLLIEAFGLQCFFSTTLKSLPDPNHSDEESERGTRCQLLIQCFLPEAQESIGENHISWPTGVPWWQCPWYNLESCNDGFKFLFVNWGYLFAQRKCTCDIGFQLRKVRFSLLILGKAWVSKVTDMAGTNKFPEAKSHSRMGHVGISITSGEFSRCQVNRDP